MIELPLTAIRLSEETQVRVAIKKAVVAAYAMQMSDGCVFPPVVVFREGETYHLADGHHRVLAAQHLGWWTIAADVREGTRAEALWFAFGANNAHGQRTTYRDKTRMVKMALDAFPARSGSDIARQIGCSPALVTRTIQLMESQSLTTEFPAHGRRQRLVQQKREAVRAMLQTGAPSARVTQELRAHGSLVADVRRELGLNQPVKQTREFREARLTRIRELALEAHTSHQIAAEVGLTVEVCRRVIREAGISVPADVVTRGTRHLDSNRMMGRIVADADDLTAGVSFIDFTTLDPEPIDDWIETLKRARRTLGMFITRLTKTKGQSYGKAAKSHTIENPSSTDFTDADPAGARDAARVS